MRGFDVDVATSGEEAIEKASSVRFRAVVLDYAMPSMDGIETIRELRVVDSEIPFMLLSGNATIKAAIEAARLGAVDVLEKPVDIDTISEKINEACP
jgi:DNA-binding NtrC family response regulator